MLFFVFLILKPQLMPQMNKKEALNAQTDYVVLWSLDMLNRC